MNLREIDAQAPLNILSPTEESLEPTNVTTWSCRIRPAQGETDARENLALMTSFKLPKLSFLHSAYLDILVM